MRTLQNVCEKLTIEELKSDETLVEMMNNSSYKKGRVLSIDDNILQKYWTHLMNKVRTLLQSGDKVMCTTTRTRGGSYLKGLKQGRNYTVSRTKLASHGHRHLVMVEELPGYYYSSKRFKKIHK